MIIAVSLFFQQKGGADFDPDVDAMDQGKSRRLDGSPSEPIDGEVLVMGWACPRIDILPSRRTVKASSRD
jgi:hypothetical protein